MYRKLLVALSIAMAFNAAIEGKTSSRCVTEVLNCKKTLETRRVMSGFEDIKMLHELGDIIEHQMQQKKRGIRSTAVNLRLLLMFPELLSAIPFMGFGMSQVPGLNKNAYIGKGFPWGLEPGNLIFLSPMDIPETDALVRKHARNMGVEGPITILLSRAKGLKDNPAANLLEATGCVIITEAELKQKLNDNQLEGIIVRALADIKRSHKASGFAVAFLKSNMTFAIANLALGLCVFKLLNKETDAPKGSYMEVGKKWIDTLETEHPFLGFLAKATPNAIMSFIWARVLKRMEKSADYTAAYNTKSTQNLIEYLRHVENNETFNMELWDQAKDRINDSELGMISKAISKTYLWLMKEKFFMNSRLFCGQIDTGDRIKSLEATLKRYQPIVDIETAENPA